MNKQPSNGIKIKLKPDFWTTANASPGGVNTSINLKKKWKLIVSFTIIIALLPLFVMVLVDYSLTRKIIQTELKVSMLNSVKTAAACLSIKAFPNTADKTGNSGLSEKTLYSLTESLTTLNENQSRKLYIIAGKLFLPSSIPAGGLTVESFYTHLGKIKKTDGTFMLKGNDNTSLLIAYARVSPSLTVLQINNQHVFTDLYFKPRLKLLGYLIICIVLILLTILGTTTYLVGRIHTADKKRVDALHHAESSKKLSAIGRLASGVAHEINNPLAIINEKSGLIADLIISKNHVPADPRIPGLLKDISSAVQRCSTVTRRLLDFARHMEPSIERVSIRQIVRQILTFFQKEAFKSNITLKVEIPDDLPKCETDRGSVQQILLNLIENAFDAMKNGGTLSIFAKPYKNDTICVTVKDTGTGIAPNDIHKIFEPFYSSKDQQWETGLGLSLVYGLTKELGGEITVKSKEGHGTQFTLMLPLHFYKTSQMDKKQNESDNSVINKQLEK